MHTWAPYNPEDHRMSARRLLSAWSVVALCALALSVLSPISGTETSDHVTMTGCAQHHAAPKPCALPIRVSGFSSDSETVAGSTDLRLARERPALPIPRSPAISETRETCDGAA